HSGFCKAVILSIRELYQIDDLRDDTIEPLLERVAANNQPGIIDRILRDICGIECCVINTEDPGDLGRRTAHAGLYLPVLGIGGLCSDEIDIADYERGSGLKIQSFQDWLGMIDWYFERWGRHVVSLKNVCGYWRDLHFASVSEAQAESAFEK